MSCFAAQKVFRKQFYCLIEAGRLDIASSNCTSCSLVMALLFLRNLRSVRVLRVFCVGIRYTKV